MTETVKQGSYHKNQIVTSAFLKWLAMGTMLIDHIGALIIEPWLMSGRASIDEISYWSDVDSVLRLIGRLAFPIFCFLLVEGFHRTSNVKKYALRLGIFALISEIPFNLGISQMFLNTDHQNIFFTLLAGLLAIWVIEKSDNVIVKLMIVAAMIIGAEVLNTDYGAYGVIMIIILHWCHYHRQAQAIVGAVYNLSQLTAALAFIPIYFYNGRKGWGNSKWLYWIYPIHILLYALIYRYFFIYN